MHSCALARYNMYKFPNWNTEMTEAHKWILPSTYIGSWNLDWESPSPAQYLPRIQ